MVVEAKRMDGIERRMCGVRRRRQQLGDERKKRKPLKIGIKQSDRQREEPREICDATEER